MIVVSGIRIAGAAVVLAFASSAIAWIDTGHMAIATIAQSNIKAAVRREIESLFAVDADPKTNSFVTSSCWADDRKTPQTGPWHYYDIFYRKDSKRAKNKPAKENAVWAIDKFSKVLADRRAPREQRLEALKYIVHIVGDLHQPLHCESRESDALPGGDRGGNDFKIVSPPGLNPAPRSLHFLWDLGGGLFVPVARPLPPDGVAKVESLAADIVRLESENAMREARDIRPMSWVKEGLKISKELVYNLPEATVPSFVYLAKCQSICARRAALAGYRLASLLNSLLD